MGDGDCSKYALELTAPYLINGYMECAAGRVPIINTDMVLKDILGAWKVRWKINRMDYRVKPGLYAVGRPGENSPVLVTANYKLSFDMLRKELNGLDAWILVIDTKGINVWCAAGEGTFGTIEIVKRIKQFKLSDVVSHRNVILPQLGAPGVAARKVTALTGFKVIYGPVRAKDIKSFIQSSLKADSKMRTVEFSLQDRLVLTPVELAGSIKALLIILALLFLLNFFIPQNAGLYNTLVNTTIDFVPYLGSVIIGCVVVPALLPYIPGRAFSLKGALLGLIWAGFITIIYNTYGIREINLLSAVSSFLILPAIASYLSLNFTGCTTYTSPSGVKKELRMALPVIIASISLGAICTIANTIIQIFN